MVQFSNNLYLFHKHLLWGLMETRIDNGIICLSTTNVGAPSKVIRVRWQEKHIYVLRHL